MPDKAPKRALVIPLAVFLVIALGMGGIWYAYQLFEIRSKKARLELKADQVATQLEDYLSVRLRLIGGMKEGWTTQAPISKAEFEDIALRIQKNFSGIQAINWINTDGVITWVVPEETNLAAKGKDLKKHPGAANTFGTSAKTGAAMITPPLTLLQGGGGFAGYYPIWIGNDHYGYINAVFRTEDMIKDCLPKSLWTVYFFVIRDKDKVCYAHQGEPGRKKGVSVSKTFRVQNRQWEVTLERKPALAALEENFLDESILVLGLIFALVFAWVSRLLLLRDQQLRDSEEYYRTIFETRGTPTVIFGNDSIIQQANAEFVQMMGYDKSEIEGKKKWMDFTHESQLKKLAEFHRKRKIDPRLAPTSYETVVVDKTGEAREGIMTINMIPGTDLRVASFLDLTERKQAEQQMFRAEKMASLGQIIAGVAHEINNPNNFIYFNLPILKKYIEAIKPILDRMAAEHEDFTILNMPYANWKEDISKLVDNMVFGSSRINGIVAELKNFIRGHEQKEKAPESLQTVIDHVMTLIGKQVRKMVRSLKIEIERPLPMVMMEIGKLEQVLINLLINAGQAADKENSWVILTARVSPARTGYMEVIVEDNGCGIPDEIKDQIFDPFFTTKSRDQGTGLGLGISQRIVHEHDGEIKFESREGKGAKFIIELPVYQENE